MGARHLLMRLTDYFIWKYAAGESLFCIFSRGAAQ